MIPTTGRPLHTIQEVSSSDSEDNNHIDGDGEDRMEEDGKEEKEEEFGSPTRLMNHFV